MDKKFIKFDDSEIKKYKFHQYKSPTAIDNIDVNEIVILNILLCIKFRILKKIELYAYFSKNECI